MKKYENVIVEIILLSMSDILTTSTSIDDGQDNVTSMPDFD